MFCALLSKNPVVIDSIKQLQEILTLENTLSNHTKHTVVVLCWSNGLKNCLSNIGEWDTLMDTKALLKTQAQVYLSLVPSWSYSLYIKRIKEATYNLYMQDYVKGLRRNQFICRSIQAATSQEHLLELVVKKNSPMNSTTNSFCRNYTKLFNITNELLGTSTKTLSHELSCLCTRVRLSSQSYLTTLIRRRKTLQSHYREK